MLMAAAKHHERASGHTSLAPAELRGAAACTWPVHHCEAQNLRWNHWKLVTICTLTSLVQALRIPVWVFTRPLKSPSSSLLLLWRTLSSEVESFYDPAKIASIASFPRESGLPRKSHCTQPPWLPWSNRSLKSASSCDYSLALCASVSTQLRVFFGEMLGLTPASL